MFDLSEQRSLDCAINLGCMGGGWMTVGIDHVIKNAPYSTEEDYPYLAKKGECNPQKSSANLVVNKRVSGSGTDHLAEVLATYSPSVAVDASSWSTYKGGVMSVCGTSLNHGVQVVGVKDGNWVVRNSWGKRWGIEYADSTKGYIELAKGDTCGISTEIHYLVAE